MWWSHHFLRCFYACRGGFSWRVSGICNFHNISIHIRSERTEYSTSEATSNQDQIGPFSRLIAFADRLLRMKCWYVVAGSAVKSSNTRGCLFSHKARTKFLCFPIRKSMVELKFTRQNKVLDFCSLKHINTKI
jgi:hypothetical protein